VIRGGFLLKQPLSSSLAKEAESLIGTLINSAFTSLFQAPLDTGHRAVAYHIEEVPAAFIRLSLSGYYMFIDT
jgi:hypothetical protein